MRKLKLFLSLLMLISFSVGNVCGAVVSGTTYATNTSSFPSGWTKDVNSASSATQLVLYSGNFIQTDDFCQNGFTSIVVKARKYGGPSATERIITVEWVPSNGDDPVVLGTLDPTTTTLTNKTLSSFTNTPTANTSGSIKIYCAAAASTKGDAVSEVTITYTAGTCGSSCTNTVTITKGAETNGTYTLSATSICGDGDGEDVTISDITPAAGYAFDEITTSASGTVDNVNKKVTGITANTTITVKFKELQKYTVSFSTGAGNPTQADIKEATAGAGIELPAGPTPSCSADGWVFAGWKETSAVDEQTTTAPTLLAAGANYKPADDCTLYAVYKRTDEGGAVSDLSVTETFSNQTPGTNYQSTIDYSAEESNAGIGWTMYYGTVSTNDAVSGNNAQMRWYSSAVDNKGYILTTTPISGLQKLSFKARVSSTDVKVAVWYSTDGSTWTLKENDLTLDGTGASNIKTFNSDIDGTVGTDYYIKIGVSSGSTAPSSGNYKLGIDDVKFDYKAASSTTYYLSAPTCVADPTVTLTPKVIDFGTVYRGESVETQEIAIAGSNLTEDALTFTRKAGEESKFSVALKEGNSLTPASQLVNAALLVTPNTSEAGEFSDSIRINGGGLGQDTARAFVKINVKERVWTEDGADHDFGTILQYGDKPEPYVFTLKGTHLTPGSDILIQNSLGTNYYVFSPDYVTVDAYGEINEEITVSLESTQYPSTMTNTVHVRSNGDLDPGVERNLFTVTTAVTIRYEVTKTTDEHGNTFEWVSGTTEIEKENNPQYVIPTTFVKATATPAAGYQFDSWNIYNTDDSETKVEHVNGEFNMPNHDVTISGSFSKSVTPDIAVSETELDFGSVDVNSTPVPQTFTITGANLMENVAINWRAEAGYDQDFVTWEVTEGSLTPEGGAVAATVTVTPKTNAVEEFLGELIISSAGATDKHLSLYLVVNKRAAGLVWSAEEATVTIDADDNIFPTLNNPNSLAIAYSANNDAVATINAETGAIELVGAGDVTITAASEATATHLAGEVSYTLHVQKKNTATWYVNGVAAKVQKALAGTALEEAPDATPAGDCADLFFQGWAESVIEGTQAEAPTYTSKTEMPEVDVNFYAVYATKNVVADVKKVDNVNYTFVGVEGTSYATWEGKTGTSGAVYAGSTAGGNESVQMRSNKSVDGFVTTSTGAGKVTKFTATWNSNTAATRTIDIYGKTTAYTAASDLYGANAGTLLGSLNIDNATAGVSELSVTGNYTYIGVRSNSGALYLDNVAIEWTVPGSISYSDFRTTCPSCASVALTKGATTNGAFTLAVGGVEVESVKTCDAATIDVEFEPAAGYKLSEFTISGVAGATYADGKISIPAETTGTLIATATFALADYTVTMAQTGDASATLSDNQENKHMGDVITVSTNEPAGYVFIGWVADPAVEFTNVKALETTFTLPASNVTVTAKFAKILSVAEAIAIIDADKTKTTANVVVEAYVSSFYSKSVSASGQISYYVSDLDENGFFTGTEFEAYNGKGLNGANFTALSDIAVGDKVRIFGNIKYFSSYDIYEFEANNYLLAQTPKGEASVVAYGTASKTEYFYNEDFEFGGLKAKQLYANGYAVEIESGINWSAEPAQVTASGDVAVTATYNEVASAPYNVAVIKALRAPELSWPAAAPAYLVGRENTLPAVVNPHSLAPLTYESSVPAVATIDENTGAIELLTAGTTTLTASFAGNEEYAATNVEYVLNVYGLESVTVGGTASVTAYEAGDAFVRTGLTATANYKCGELVDEYNITENEATEWSVDPANVEAGTEKVTVSATWNGKTGSKDVNVAILTHEVTIATPENGTLVVKVGGEAITSGDKFAKGTIVTVEATPADGYRLNSLTVNTADIENEQFVVGTLTTYAIAATFVEKLDADLAWSAAEAKAYTAGKEYELPSLTNDHELAVVYSSTVPAVATISEEGVVSLVAAGETVIKASFAGNAIYNAQEVSYTLTVVAPTALAISGECKTAYEAGETFDREGLKAIATFGDESVLDVTDLATWIPAEAPVINEDGTVLVGAAWEGLNAAKEIAVEVKTHKITFSGVEGQGMVSVMVSENVIASGDEKVKGTELNVYVLPTSNYNATSILVNGVALEGTHYEGDYNEVLAGTYIVGTEDIVITATFEEKPILFYITGEGEALGNWNPAGIASHSESYTLNLPAGDYKMKITIDGTWGTAKGRSDLSFTPAGVSADGNDNICFTLAEAGEVDVYYTGIIFSVTGDFYVEPVDYYLKNNWNGESDWTWKKMTQYGELYRLENVVFGGQGVNYNTTGSDGSATWVPVEAFLGDEIGALDTVTLVLDPTLGNITAILLGKYVEPAPKFYIAGSFTSWMTNMVELTQDGDILSAAIELGEKQDYQFKVVKVDHLNNETWYGAEDYENQMKYGQSTDWQLTTTDGGYNINLKTTAAYNYVFKFNPENAKLSVVIPEMPTAIDEVNADEQARKYMLNGQFFIERGGKVYDAQGQLVK